MVLIFRSHSQHKALKQVKVTNVSNNINLHPITIRSVYFLQIWDSLFERNIFSNFIILHKNLPLRTTLHPEETMIRLQQNKFSGTCKSITVNGHCKTYLKLPRSILLAKQSKERNTDILIQIEVFIGNCCELIGIC